MKAWFFILCTLPLAGCFLSKKEVTPISYEGSAFGSYYKVKFLSGPTTPGPQALQAETEKLISDYNNEFSAWKPDSFISQFNKSTTLEPQKVSAWGLELMMAAREVWGATSGAYDPTVAPLVQLWGFGSQKSNHEPTASELSKVRPLIGLEKLKVNYQDSTWQKTVPGLQVDINSLAPGHVADLIGKLLEARGIKDYLVDVGGELTARGMKGEAPWMVGIERPSQTYGEGVVKSLPLKNEAIATSGNYRNFRDTKKGRISHTIDPRTGEQPQHKTVSVTVIAKTAIEADAWATALMVLGPLVLQENHELAKLLVIKDIKVYLLEDAGNGKFQETMNRAMKTYLEK